jgi:hypothetical protein
MSQLSQHKKEYANKYSYPKYFANQDGRAFCFRDLNYLIVLKSAKSSHYQYREKRERSVWTEAEIIQAGYKQVLSQEVEKLLMRDWEWA